MVRSSVKIILVVTGFSLLLLLIISSRTNDAVTKVGRSNGADATEVPEEVGVKGGKVQFGSPFVNSEGNKVVMVKMDAGEAGVTAKKKGSYSPSPPPPSLRNKFSENNKDKGAGSVASYKTNLPGLTLKVSEKKARKHVTVMRDGIPLGVLTEEEVMKLTDEVLGKESGRLTSLQAVGVNPALSEGATSQVKGSIHVASDAMPTIQLLRRGLKEGLPAEVVHRENRPAMSTPPSPSMPTFLPSKDLFVRAVYFDDRPRDDHRNVSVFLVVCLKNITDKKLILGCQVDDHKASQFSVKLIGETPLWRAFYPQIDHEEVLVHCYDLPARNGSKGYITYKKSPSSEVTIAASERPLLIPPPRVKPTSSMGVKYNMTIVTCAKIFRQPPWLKEWLTYQRTLGVDHVHLDAEDSFVKSGGLEKPWIKELLSEGFLSVDVWKEYLGMWEIWYHNQGLIYEDCPYRFRGTYDYIVMLDTDDFFVPREPRELKLHYYINRYCRWNGIGSCKFRWVEYFPDTYGFNNKSTVDGNITRALKSFSHYNQGNPKSLHRTTALIDTATHYAYIMMPEYKIYDVSVNVAYVAHVRKWKKLPDNGLIEGLPNSGLCHCASRILVVTLVSIVFAIFRSLDQDNV